MNEPTMISHTDWVTRFKPVTDNHDSMIDHAEHITNLVGAGFGAHIWTLLDQDESTDHIPAKYKDEDGEVISWEDWQDDPDYEAGISCIIVSGNHWVNRLETYVCEVAVTGDTFYQVED